MKIRKAILVAVTLLLVSPSDARSKGYKELLKQFDDMLGQTEQAMREGWCDHINGKARNCLQPLPDGRKRMYTTPLRGGFVYNPGNPSRSTSITTGDIDRSGNITAWTTTTEIPAVEPSGGLFTHVRPVFYFEAGKVYRWEIEQCASHSETYNHFAWHTPWRVVGIRELRAGKIVTVKKPQVLAWH